VSANVEIFGFVTDIDHVEVLRTFGETCSTEFSSLSHTTAVSRTELAYIVAEYSWLDKVWGREINSFLLQSAGPAQTRAWNAKSMSGNSRSTVLAPTLISELYLDKGSCS
jgi:hypothetical protein